MRLASPPLGQVASVGAVIGVDERAIVAALQVAGLAASAEVKTRDERLTQVTGVGPVSAYTLLAHLPELDKLPRGDIAP